MSNDSRTDQNPEQQAGLAPRTAVASDGININAQSDTAARVLAIFCAPEKHAPMTAQPAVQLKSGKGMVGDRFFGHRKNAPGRNLTLIESEAIAAVAAVLGIDIPAQGPRRNLLTQGIALNALLGRRFRVGNVLLEGIELCEPCVVLGRQLATPTVPAATLIHAFAGRGGLRAAVLEDGVIRTGDLLIHCSP